MEEIAVIRTDLKQKFGLPRQSGLADGLKGTIVFHPKYRDPNALRGIEGWSHLWILWKFSLAERDTWSPTVRPPRLGGNTYMGVFATRSPFRPNPIGLSCVKLEGIDLDTPDGPVLRVSGIDMMDGTPVYDIKPYLPYADCRPEASGGFAEAVKDYALKVECPEELLARIPEEKREGLLQLLAQDPRPAYKRNDSRVFGFGYAGFEVRFSAENGVLYVVSIEKSER